jgi:hypothetical protein
MKKLVTVAVCLLFAAGASGQTNSPAAPGADASEPAPPVATTQTPAAAQVPDEPHDEHAAANAMSFHLRGFTDIDFAQTNDKLSPDGFSLGQFAAHMSAALGAKVSFFGETSFTARSNAFTVEVERLILRYDYNDAFKISVGRYHTPINYWNTAFHHGLWLQTTISRPQMIQVSESFQPVHFVGLLAEGTVGPPTAGLGYNFGVGNGRGAILSRAGDAGDVNRNRAWLAKIYARPGSFSGLELGTAIYHDRLTVPLIDAVPELISSAYLALTRETPEVIAEFANVRHYNPLTRTDVDSQAYYIQAAWRFTQFPDLKPYGRFEQMLGHAADIVLGDVTSSTTTLGLRYELSDAAALKAEYRHMRRPITRQMVDGVYLQAAFTF